MFNSIKSDEKKPTEKKKLQQIDYLNQQIRPTQKTKYLRVNIKKKYILYKFQPIFRM